MKVAVEGAERGGVLDGEGGEVGAGPRASYIGLVVLAGRFHQKHRAKAIATALIALDIGLAVQHFVDPGEVPLDLYPELYVLLFSPLAQQTETRS